MSRFSLESLKSLNKMGAMNQNSAPIAIDLGVSAMRILQVSPGEKPSLVSAASLDTPDELINDHTRRVEFQLAAVPGMIKAAGFKGKRVVCSIPACLTFCKHIQVQKIDGASLESLAKGAIAAQIGCDPSLLVMRHTVVGDVSRGTGPAQTEVICLAAAREMVERIMHAIKSTKLEPVGVHSEYLAANCAFQDLYRRKEDAETTTIYLDLGAGSTKVLIANGPDLVFAKGIELGGSNLDEMVAKELKISLSQARQKRIAGMCQFDSVKSEASAARKGAAAAQESEGGLAMLSAGMRKEGVEPVGVSQSTAVAQERREGRVPDGFSDDLRNIADTPQEFDPGEHMEILTDEISMCMRYYQSIFPDRKVDRAVFIGGGARDAAMCKHIASALKVPGQSVDPLARIKRTGKEPVAGVDFSQPQPAWTVAYGLTRAPTDL